MTTFFHRYADDSPALRVHLHPLSEYVADGGRFSDAGNGGEDCRADALAGEFLCAVSVDPTTLGGLTIGDACDLIGVPYNGLWYDSATGWMLLREWPAEAPLEARVGGFEQLTNEERALLVDEVRLEREPDPDSPSVPSCQHVLDLLEGDHAWEREQADYHRAAYIRNVYRVAEAVWALDPTPEQVPAVVQAVVEAATVAA